MAVLKMIQLQKKSRKINITKDIPFGWKETQPMMMMDKMIIKPKTFAMKNPNTSFYQPEHPVKKYTVTYQENSAVGGFSSKIKVEAISRQQAIDKAKYEVAGAYGSAKLKRFTFYI